MVWRPRYKQLCAICRKNHVLILQRNQFPICTSCGMKQINQPIQDEKFRKLFDIDQKLYEQSSFLRSIKSNYLRFGSLSEKQVETFKRVAAELANPKNSGVANNPEVTPIAAFAADGKEESADEKIKKPKPKSRKTKK